MSTKRKPKTTWRPHFAWRPVIVGHTTEVESTFGMGLIRRPDYAWLVRVERRFLCVAGEWIPEYRTPRKAKRKH